MSDPKLKAFAIGGKKRSPLLPNLPTFAELGYPDVETHAWFGLFLPAGSPREAVRQIYQDAKKVLDDPTHIDRETSRLRPTAHAASGGTSIRVAKIWPSCRKWLKLELTEVYRALSSAECMGSTQP